MHCIFLLCNTATNEGFTINSHGLKEKINSGRYDHSNGIWDWSQATHIIGWTFKWVKKAKHAVLECVTVAGNNLGQKDRAVTIIIKKLSDLSCRKD